MANQPAIRVLVVDDSPAMRRMVLASLRGLNRVTFHEAGNGLEAIEKLALVPTGLMTLDLNMPEMHGLEVIRFVRNLPSRIAMPIIVLTTQSSEESRRKAMDAGATRYLTKPFQPDSLLACASELLDEPPQ